MTFQEIIGHRFIKERLLQSVYRNKILNSYIFEGAEGIGKKTMAKAFASAILCKSGGEKPCGNCDACLKTFSDNHPDILYVYVPKDRKTIGIDVIREQIIEQIYIKPLLADKKIIVIPAGEALTEQSQNGLLKVLEEPPSYAVFIILVPKASMLLDTVLSRSGVFTFLPLSKEETKQYFEERFHLEAEKRDFAITFSQGIIGKGIQILENEIFLEIYQQTVKNVIRLKRNRNAITDCMKFFTECKENIDVVVDFMLIWLRDCIFTKLNMQEKVICKDKMPELMEFSETISKKGLVCAMDWVIAFKNRIAKNVNFNGATLSMLMSVQEELNDKCSGNSI